MPDLASRLAGHASATALLEGDARISYAELSDRVQRTAGALQRAGLPPGARVALLADSTVDGVVGYLAVQAAGMLPVMLSARSPLPELERRYDEIDPAFTLYGAAVECVLPANVTPFRPAGSSADDFEVLQGDPVPSRPGGADDPAVVLYTSGVSGLPRPIVLTYGNLEATRNGLVNAPGSGPLPQWTTTASGASRRTGSMRAARRRTWTGSKSTWSPR